MGGSSPMFGDVTVVFSTEYVKDMVLMAPMDTGRWYMNGCDKTLHAIDVESQFPPPHHFHSVNCSAWDPAVVGTFDHHDHLILASWGLSANGSFKNDTIIDKARQYFQRR